MDVWILWRSLNDEVDWFENIVGVYATLALAQQRAAVDHTYYAPNTLGAWRQDGDTWIAEVQDPDDEDFMIQYAIQAFPVVQAPA